jgi:hypothetical protein
MGFSLRFKRKDVPADGINGNSEFCCKLGCHELLAAL